MAEQDMKDKDPNAARPEPELPASEMEGAKGSAEPTQYEAADEIQPEEQVGQHDLSNQQIRFPNGNRSRITFHHPESSPDSVIEALGLQLPEAIFLLVGGKNDDDDDFLSQPYKPPSSIRADAISTVKKTKAVASSSRSTKGSKKEAGTSTRRRKKSQAATAAESSISREAYLIQLFSRGIARTAVDMGAMIIDNGPADGITAMMGQGVADRGRQSVLLGVAPVQRVTYPGAPDEERPDTRPLDQNHTDFVLTEGEQWGDESATIVELAAALAQEKPIFTVLVNGGSQAKQQLLHSVRQGWPIIIIRGSGHLADEIADLWQNRPDFIPDPGIAEIIADGRLHFLRIDRSVDNFAWLAEQLLRQHQTNLIHDTQSDLICQQIYFPDKKQAKLIAPPDATPAEDIISALDIETPEGVLIVIGGSKELSDLIRATTISSSDNGSYGNNQSVGYDRLSQQSGMSQEILDSIYDLLIEGEELIRIDRQVPARLAQLFRLGIGPTVIKSNLAIIDGGRRTGVTAMVGQGLSAQKQGFCLIGVAPASRVTYPGGPAEGSLVDGESLDPNNTHFVLTEGRQWGDETGTMYNLAAALVRDEAGQSAAKSVQHDDATKDRLAATILINGDEIAKQQVVRSVQLGWPVIVVAGTGGLADEICNLRTNEPAFIPDPDLATIMAQGKIHLLELEDSVTGFNARLDQLMNEQLLRHHQADITSIEQAWQTFGTYDAAAKRQQISFNRMQMSILALGVLGTFLALAQATLHQQSLINLSQIEPYYTYFDNLLYFIILLIPIAITAMAAFANEASAGKKWILLRASAESIKKEIYRYRAKAEIYSDQATRKISREKKLAQRVNSVSANLMTGEAKVAAIKDYDGPIPPLYGAAEGDDGLSDFTPDRYLPLRLEDQYNWYKRRTIQLERKLRRLQWSIYIFGGAGTLLVALNFELWIAMTTALVTAFTTYMEYQQVESTLIRYNKTAADLHRIMVWWEALTVEDQANPKNVNILVGRTEASIHSEHAAWVQEMQDAIDELAAQQSQDDSSDGDAKGAERMSPDEAEDLLKLFEDEEEPAEAAKSADDSPESADSPGEEPPAQSTPTSAEAEPVPETKS